MRTKEQIDKIKQTESDPVQLWNVVTQQEINDLINHYHSSDNVIEKSTGPKVLKINLDEGLIDNIVEKLKYT